MTALADIRAALGAVPPPQPGHTRALQVGTGAMRALSADIKGLMAADAPQLDGVPIQPTTMFDGWAIVDHDAAAGKWYER